MSLISRIFTVIVIILLLIVLAPMISQRMKQADAAVGQSFPISYNLTFKVGSVNIWGNTVTGCVKTRPGTEFNWGEDSIYAKLITNGSTEKVKMVVNIGGTDYVVDRQNNEICK